MDYQAYKKEFLESLRNDSAINGTDTEDEFLNRTLSLLVDYDEVNDPWWASALAQAKKIRPCITPAA